MPQCKYCDSRYAFDDELRVHEHRHEELLKLGTVLTADEARAVLDVLPVGFCRGDAVTKLLRMAGELPL